MFAEKMTGLCLKRMAMLKNVVPMQRLVKNSCGALPFSTRMEPPTPSNIWGRMVTLFGLDGGMEHHVRARPPKSQDELPERCMQDSFSTIVLPLASSREMRSRCATSSGSVRVGRLIEYMDLIAVWTTIQYVSIPTMKPGEVHPYTFPTVLVDHVDFTNYTPKSDLDIRYCSHVTWAGRSSCEVLLQVEQDTGHGVWERIAQAVFVMVVRDFVTFASGFVNKLLPKDDRERQLLAEAEGRKAQRAQLASTSLLRTVPGSEEQSLLHQLFVGSVEPGSSLLSGAPPPGSVWLGDTTHVSSVVSYPEDENIHGTVFGGFIMRRAVEVSETCAQLHSKQQPRLRHVSEFQFFRGVEVSSLLSMHSQVVFAQQEFMHVVTHGEVLDADSGQSMVVALLHCTFQVPAVVASILPRTYGEAMKYLDGRRHFMRVLKLESKL